MGGCYFSSPQLNEEKLNENSQKRAIKISKKKKTPALQARQTHQNKTKNQL